MTSRDEHEFRAFEALVVSRLRNGCSDDNDLKKLPALTQEEKNTLNCLKAGFIENLIKQVDSGELPACNDLPTVEEKFCGELVHGMNRAEVISDETSEELNRRRLELQKKLQEEEDGRRDRSGG